MQTSPVELQCRNLQAWQQAWLTQPNSSGHLSHAVTGFSQTVKCLEEAVALDLISFPPDLVPDLLGLQTLAKALVLRPSACRFHQRNLGCHSLLLK